MIIVLLGASGSGKSTIEKELATHHGFKKIISHTTRQPRDGEENGKYYWFTDNETFKEILDRNLFAEYDEYSQNRLYGTLKSDYVDENKVVVLTPNGLRQLKKNCPYEDIVSILVEASLGTRIKRYIDRCGTNEFNFTDASEIFERIQRDFGMFLGLEKEVNMVVHNDEGINIKDLVSEILAYA
jgi:guanylate kinase